jgi:flagellar biosynthesis GTPase FlhF
MPGCRSSRRAESWKTAGRIPSALTIFDSRDSWRPVSSGFADQDNPFADPIPSGRWPGVAWLEARGLLPEFAGRLQRHLSDIHASASATRDAEWNAVLAALATFWRSPSGLEEEHAPQTHAFVGPAGSGKTTALCKWLTLAVLTEGRSASVQRLDSTVANTAEFLTVQCEMLGVPVERFCSSASAPVDLNFVDLPGVEAEDSRALAALQAQLASLPSPQIHLVLNAAYETEALLAQWHAFAPLHPADLILTHLDEEPRRIKLWNMVFGTNYIIRFLSAGQKIPGQFQSAVPGLLFPVEFNQ